MYRLSALRQPRQPLLPQLCRSSWYLCQAIWQCPSWAMPGHLLLSARAAAAESACCAERAGLLEQLRSHLHGSLTMQEVEGEVPRFTPAQRCALIAAAISICRLLSNAQASRWAAHWASHLHLAEDSQLQMMGLHTRQACQRQQHSHAAKHTIVTLHPHSAIGSMTASILLS